MMQARNRTQYTLMALAYLLLTLLSAAMTVTYVLVAVTIGLVKLLGFTLFFPLSLFRYRRTYDVRIYADRW